MQTVPSSVERVFTPEVLARLGSVRRPVAPVADAAAEPMRLRHVIFSGEELTGEALRLRRAAWWSYVVHAEAVGLLDDDLCARLADVNDDTFRGALAECLVSWFFRNKLRVVLRRHRGEAGARHADFEGDENLHVEVKAPYVPVPGDRFAGDDAKKLRDSLQEAGRQFKHGMVNIVVLVPLLRTPVWMDRDQLVKAVIGEWARAVYVSLDPNLPAPEAADVFLQNGKLAKVWGRKPDLTKVSAVVSIEEETMLGPQGVVLRHYVHVVHNPFAAKPLPESMFAGHPQLVARSAGMVWTDWPRRTTRMQRLVVWTMAFGPTVAWVVLVVVRLGRTRLGYSRALAPALFTGLGVLGLTALLLAYLPATIERLGFKRVGAFLRRRWDEDVLEARSRR